MNGLTAPMVIRQPVSFERFISVVESALWGPTRFDSIEAIVRALGRKPSVVCETGTFLSTSWWSPRRLHLSKMTVPNTKAYGAYEYEPIVLKRDLSDLADAIEEFVPSWKFRWAEYVPGNPDDGVVLFESSSWVDPPERVTPTSPGFGEGGCFSVRHSKTLLANARAAFDGEVGEVVDAVEGYERLVAHRLFSFRRSRH